MTPFTPPMAGTQAESPRVSVRLGLWFAAFVALAAWRWAALDRLGLDLQVDEAQYWDWSRDLAWGYFSKPPAIAALIAASTALFGDGVMGVKALPALCWLGATAVVARLGWELGGPRTGVWAAAWFATTPAAMLLGLFATTDAPLMLCWALALWSLWRVACTGSWRAWTALGLCLGLGLLSKYTMAAFLVTAVGVLARAPAHRGRWVGAGLMLGLAGLIVAPNLAWNLAHGGVTWQHTAQLTLAAGTAAAAAPRPAALGGLAEFAVGQAVVLGPALVLWAALLLRARWRGAVPRSAAGDADADAAAWRLCVWAAVPLWAIGLAVAARSGAQINWCAPALVGACLGVALMQTQTRASAASGRLAAGVLAAQLAVGAAVMHWPNLARVAPAPLASLDPFVRMRGWDQAFATLDEASRRSPDGPGLREGDCVIGLSRTVMAQGRRAWRDRGLQWVAWPPLGPPRHHYELTRPWTVATANAPGEAGLWALTDGASADERRLQALGARPVAQAERPNTRGRRMTLTLWRLPSATRPPA